MWLFSWAAAIVLVVSFVALSTLWMTPQLQEQHRRVLVRLPAALEWLACLVGVGLFVLVVYSGLAGAQVPLANLDVTFIYTIPDFKTAPMKMSSVVLASQIQPSSKKGKIDNPLLRDGSEIIPSVTHVFTNAQHLYLYYEVYDPAKETAAAGQPKLPADSIRILSNVEFFQGKVKTYETPLLETKELNAENRHAAVFQLDVPLNQLKPGFYTCQVNVIDDAAGHFLFPRLAMYVRQ